MPDDARFTVAVAGVVMNADGHVLLIKTEQAGWELPGGRVEHGEDLITALKREVREESECDVEVRRLVSLSSSTTSAGGALVMFTFLCSHAGGEPRAADDSLDAGWFAPEVAVQLVTHAGERARLHDALTHRAGVMYRVYRARPKEAEQQARYDL